MNVIDNKQYIEVCRVEDLYEGEGRTVKVLVRSAAVFNVGGKIYAIEGQCKHQKACLVRSGSVNGRTVKCKRHGWLYDIIDGKAVGREYGDLRTFKVLIKNGLIYLDREEILNGAQYNF